MVALFSVRDRIAIAVICAVILAGWGARLWMRGDRTDDLRLIRGAVEVPVQSPVLPDTSAASASDSPTAGKVDINRAVAADFEKLPGIGPVKARAIVEYRIKNGSFAKISDIQNVTGIGPKTFERIAPLLTVGGTK